MNGITRREKITAGTMEALYEGGFRESAYAGYAWMCNGCRLVWERKHQAEGCADRGHRTSFEQGPYGVRYVENGRPVGNLTYYTRTAIRREAK